MRDLVVAALLSFASPGDPPVRVEGLATTYHPGDGHSGPVVGCPGASRKIFGDDRFVDGRPIVAMRPGRRPPCGTCVVVEVVRTGRRAPAIVLDSGPYGQDCHGGRRVAGKLGRGCRWRGVADLSRTVALAVGASGRERVRIRWK